MMNQLLIDQLFQCAEIEAPQEMCGLLFDRILWVARNTANNPEHAFLIDPEEYVRACMQMDGKPWALVHSHPTKAAKPSVEDCRLMDELEKTGHDLMMIIVGLAPREIRAYKKRGQVYECRWRHVPGVVDWEIGELQISCNFIQDK